MQEQRVFLPSPFFWTCFKECADPGCYYFRYGSGKYDRVHHHYRDHFAWPGMGKLLIDAINKSDRPIIVAYLMAAACMFVVLNFIVDILYTLIDPRIELR